MSMRGKAMRFLMAFCAMTAIGLSFGVRTACAQEQEMSLEAPWYFSPAIGVINYEGDEEVQDTWLAIGRLGYDYNEWWGLEFSLQIAPVVSANTRYSQVVNADGTDYVRDANGNPIKEPRTEDFDDTFGAGAYVDWLFHFTRWDRVDPFLSLGAGLMWYGDEINGEDFDPAVRGGGGVMYHFNDEWALRADANGYFVGNDTEANMTITGGLVWNWGAGVAPDFVASGGPLDSDGDGLPDEEEARYGTDPFDPDTDDDGLSDGEEVYKYKSDPLNPDTDYDALKDGVEVHKHGTDPTKRDTDNGGVADGHEVIEDSTNPLDPTDDLQLFELYLQFDYDKAIIKPEYYPKLDVVVKVLQRDPGSSARIEGHADKLKKSKGAYNKKLSKQRATAVLEYLAEHGKIAESRMEAFGYGFERPKAANDPVLGNPENRRVEVYIRRSTSDAATSQVVLPDVVTAAP